MFRVIFIFFNLEYADIFWSCYAIVQCPSFIQFLHGGAGYISLKELDENASKVLLGFRRWAIAEFLGSGSKPRSGSVYIMSSLHLAFSRSTIPRYSQNRFKGSSTGNPKVDGKSHCFMLVSP